jgi:hypothetical protein
MALFLDADSLIKLNRVGVLELVARVFECIIPEAVYLEAVVNARARGYADAEAIDRTVQELISLIPQLTRVGIISTDESRKFIESSRPLTNERNYRAALSDLEASGK